MLKNEETNQVLGLIAGNIRRLRQAKGMSQEDLAETAGLHRTYVGAIERSERNITIQTLAAFSSALETTIQELLTNEEKVHDPNDIRN